MTASGKYTSLAESPQGAKLQEEGNQKQMSPREPKAQLPPGQKGKMIGLHCLGLPEEC